jgi:hypothetical protein
LLLQENKWLRSALQTANSKANESRARIADLEVLLDHKAIAYNEQSKILANVKVHAAGQ